MTNGSPVVSVRVPALYLATIKRFLRAYRKKVKGSKITISNVMLEGALLYVQEESKVRGIVVGGERKTRKPKTTRPAETVP